MNVTARHANLHFPTEIKVGRGRVSELVETSRSLGMKNPLLVTDPNLARSKSCEAILTNFNQNGISLKVFDRVLSNPTGEQIEEGVDLYQQGHHDGIIAFGGGSSLDAGKAIALMVGQTRPLWDFEDVGDNWKRVNEKFIAPVIAIPTTAGTGSEVGRASVITNTQLKIKKIIFHPKMMPQVVILDPELTRDLPKELTAATGMDALSHCLEAYCCEFYHPIAEGIALEGMRLIKDNLLKVYQDGFDMEGRLQLLMASTMGACAFQRGLGAMHALAHSLGALTNKHHGRLNAILMPYVLRANRKAIESKINRLANYLEISRGFDGFMAWILELRESLQIEHSLSLFGIDALTTNSKKIAKMATEDPAHSGNPIPFNEKQYELILNEAITGEFSRSEDAYWTATM